MMPQSLLIETFAQVAGRLVNHSLDYHWSDIMTRVDGASFEQTVHPGDQLVITATVDTLRDEASVVSKKSS